MNIFRSTTTTPLAKNWINRPPVQCAFLLIPLALVCIALPQTTYATGGLNPPPDGGYPNANTAEGDFALFSLTTGDGNTALGFRALKFNTTGSVNTACGRGALRDNTTGSFNTAIGEESLISNVTGSDNQSIGEA